MGKYEPTQMPANYDSVDGCLKEISNAFLEQASYYKYSSS